MNLNKPITAHGVEVTELVLTPPTVMQCREIGALPYRVDENGMPQPVLPAACRYISTCGKIPPSVVDQLDLADLNVLVWQVVGFFIGSESATSAS